MKKIFISYRRADSAVFTGRLYDRLIEYYGSDSVFLDIDSIPSAAEFPKVLRESIDESGVVLAVIGRDWMGDGEAEGFERRIDDPADFVRQEIEQALRKNRPIIPVYFGGRKPLVESELPESMRALANAHAHEVDIGKDFEHHIIRLRKAVNRILIASPLKWSRHVSKRIVRRNKTWLLSLGLFGLLVWIGRDFVGRTLLPDSGIHQVVARADSQVFSDSIDGTYQVARALQDREALVAQTDIVEAIQATRQSFDMFAMTGSVIVNNYEAVMRAVANGARFRIVILDHSEQNSTHLNDLFAVSGTNATGVEWSKRNAAQVMEFVRQQNERTRGAIELRVWRGPYLNSMWIRDSKSTDNQLGHLEVTFYGDLARNPSLRFGKLSPALIPALQNQFDYIWERSIPLEP